MNRRERRGAARTSRPVSTGAGAGTAAELCDAGFRHFHAGRLLDAQLCAEQALAKDAGHADSLHLLALLSFQARHHDHALQWIARAIQCDPKPDYFACLGRTLRAQGRHDQALIAYDQAIERRPADAGLWRELADVLLDLRRYEPALRGFQHVLTLDPRHQDAAYKSGVLLNEMGRFEEALASINLCDALLPDHAPTLKARARTLANLKRFEAALADNERAHALRPGDADTCNDIGACLQALGRDQEALVWFDRALELLPTAIELLNNKALILAQLQRFDEAFDFYRHIKALHPDNATTDWNLALLHLLTGNFSAGWPLREARWRKTQPFLYPKFSQPMWLGREPIDGKTLLLHVDEGLGDTLQFVRYVPMLAARGARIILVVERALQLLLSGLPGVSQCLAFGGGPLPPFDYHCPLGSLPLVFATGLETIPASRCYLPEPAAAAVAAGEARLGPRRRWRIGLVWSGNPNHKNDINRSTSLLTMSKLFDVDASFVSLQKDPRAEDAALLAGSGIVDLTADLNDFADTAALVRCLDLVITVDTSVAHLAGALGCPTWILLPWTPDYRWLLGRDDSPWYPSVRLFRQDESRDYARVLDRVRDELRVWLAAR
jgi:tetratricopeptide (TPR) repeat protein